MTNIKYVGSITPCIINIYDLRLVWSSGEIKDLDDFHATKLIKDNSDFKYVDKVTTIEVSNEEKIDNKKEEIDMDLNNDNVVDYKDKSIAGRILAKKI